MHEGLVQILLNTEGQSGVISNILNIDFLLIFLGSRAEPSLDLCL
jgi:hypothetical protein